METTHLPVNSSSFFYLLDWIREGKMATLTSPMASHMNGQTKMKIEDEPDGRRQSSQNDDLVFDL
jgi:hypothetical protein